jgi:hypothetical protein
VESKWRDIYAEQSIQLVTVNARDSVGPPLEMNSPSRLRYGNSRSILQQQHPKNGGRIMQGHRQTTNQADARSMAAMESIHIPMQGHHSHRHTAPCMHPARAHSSTPPLSTALRIDMEICAAVRQSSHKQECSPNGAHSS